MYKKLQMEIKIIFENIRSFVVYTSRLIIRPLWFMEQLLNVAPKLNALDVT